MSGGNISFSKSEIEACQVRGFRVVFLLFEFVGSIPFWFKVNWQVS